MVLHEIWGLDPHIAEVCKRLGKLGFATAVPDLYRGNGALLTPSNIQNAMAAVWNLTLEERWDRTKVAAELARKGGGREVEEVLSVLYDQRFRKRILEIATETVLEGRARHGRVATLGFSLGGGLSLAAAAGPAPPDAAVAYCGEPPKSGFAASVPTLAIYATRDELIGPKVPALVDSAMKHGSDLTVRVLPNTRHDFFNKTKKDQYDPQAAEEAWELTEWFLVKNLGQPMGRTGSLSKR